MEAKLLRYKTIPADLRDTKKWAPADTSNFTDEERERFERFSAAIIFYLGGGKLKDAAAAAHVSTTTFLEQLNRCLVAMPDGSVLGWAGLIFNLRIKVYSRDAPLPDDGSTGEAGYAGAFGKFLLDHPSIKKEIDKAIKRGLGTKHIRTGTNTAESIFRLFLRLCKSEKIPTSNYPLNTKSRGRRALERYIKQKILNQPALTVWSGPDAAASSSVGNGKSTVFPDRLEPKTPPSPREMHSGQPKECLPGQADSQNALSSPRGSRQKRFPIQKSARI